MRLIRLLVFAAMVAGGLMLALPFYLSSRFVDERGIEITGKVETKREYALVHDSSWDRVCEAMVLYDPPDDRGVSTLVAKIDPEHFDQLRAGERTTLRYLPLKELPRVPMAESLRQMRLLPAAKLPGQVGMDPNSIRGLEWVGIGIALLVLWRKLRWPGFPCAVGIGVAMLLAGILNSEFPRPTPEPRTRVLTATGRVASIRQITHLFSGQRTRGMDAAQPIDVVGVEFTPGPRADKVLAIDLLDAGSIDGLAVGAPAAVRYEAASPRTAWVYGGTRQFAAKNLRGAVFAWGLGLGFFLGVLALVAIVGRALKSMFRRLMARHPNQYVG